MSRRWKKTKVALLSILVFIAVGCQGEEGLVTPDDPLYPTTVTPLPTSDLAALTSDLRNRYPRVCSDLDEYGHPVQRTGNGRLSCRPSVGVDVNGPWDELINAAKAAVADMFDFTEVSDPSALVTHRISVFGGSSFAKSFLTVRFKNQRHEGREVLSTQLMAWVDSLGVIGVSGHHFAEIHLPEPVFWHDVARRLILDTEILWYDAVGRERVFVVTADSYEGEPVQVIRPQKVGDTIELRVAWEIGVGSEGLSWYVYVDVVTGKTLGTRQLFST